jgi:hypothetical protein
MLLEPIDWLFIFAFFVISLVVGVAVSRRAGRSSSEFFLSGRNMPWWLLGFSMVATTFSTDTPNLVSNLVRQHGVSGNWKWWAFLLTGMLTVFIYAKLWRRSRVLTDIEFYEIRYSGKSATFLRGFRSLYLGVFFNIMVMAMVTLAAIKIGGGNVEPITNPDHCAGGACHYDFQRNGRAEGSAADRFPSVHCCDGRSSSSSGSGAEPRSSRRLVRNAQAPEPAGQTVSASCLRFQYRGKHEPGRLCPDYSSCRSVVERVVSWRRAWRRRLYRPAYAGG